MPIAKVEPLTTARALRGPFDYRLPERLGGVGVGSVLLVPFGRRRVLGVVVEVAESSELPPERLAEPLRALEAGATPELVRLGLWMAREYCSTPARGLELVLPPGVGRGGQGRGPRLEHAGGRDRGRPRGARRRDPARARASAPRSRGWPAQRPAVSSRPGARGGGADRQTLKRLEARGLVSLRSAASAGGRRSWRCRRPVARDRGCPPRSSAALARDRRRDRRRRRPRAPPARRHRLGQDRGLPGRRRGGARRGKGSIVLVPEIALTPQIVSRFATRFGDRVALLHSRLAARRAPRRVAAPAGRRGADLRRPALGDLRPGRATWAWW